MKMNRLKRKFNGTSYALFQKAFTADLFTMMHILDSIKSILKVKKVNIDNIIFCQHYETSVIVLIVFSLFITIKQYIGNPIDCMIEDIPKNIINSYCWIHGTYIVSNKINGKIGYDVIQPGVTNYINDGQNKIKYYAYYQWIGFMLLFQALLFYIPFYLWKMWEGGRIKMLSTDLNIPILNADYRRERKLAVITYLYENLHHHNVYLFRFIFCELLNLMNIIAQILFIDYFLDGEFRTYGIEVLKFIQMNPETRIDPMARIFPKVTKCSFLKYGPSGSVQFLDGLCVLPLNMINEKTFIFLWFWLLILGFFSVVAILYRIQILCMPKLRYVVLSMRTGFSSRVCIKNLLEKCYIGDWFILYQLSKNIDSIIFKEIISELNNILDTSSENLL